MMKIEIATLFPEMCERVLDESIIGRARRAGKLNISCVNIRDYSDDKFKRVDDSPYGGGMGMVMEAEPLARCCEEAADAGIVKICNYNCPGQLVIGGEKAAVARAGELAKAAGARRLMPLRVSGPFHTPLMQPAAEALHKRFETEAFGEMEIPVLFNCLGREKTEETVADLLVRQVKDSVYMEDTIRRLAELGVDTVIEIGPGRALSGFVAKTVGDAVACYAVEDCASLEAAVQALRA